MAVTGTERDQRVLTRLSFHGAAARFRAWRTDDSDSSIAQRTASTAFLIRVASAGIIYLTQVLLARWMGRFEFGIYVYVWAWVGFLGMLAAGGIAPSAQRFIPEYRTLRDNEHLRGFLVGGRWLSFAYGVAVAVLLAGVVLAISHKIAPYYWLPLLVGAAAIPIFPVSSTQDTIARCFHWIELGLLPGYVIHPLVIIATMVAIHTIGGSVTALDGLIAASAAMWAITLIQMALLRRRLKRTIEPSERKYQFRHWAIVSLPIAFVDGFFLLLTYADILILQIYVGPAEVAVYHATAKTLALINFIYFAVAAASAHRFAQYHVGGEKEKLTGFLREVVRWTFWPSLVLGISLLAVGKPILALFGPGFDEGYPMMFVLIIGLLARASVGPAERLLSMQGQQSICAIVYACAFATNLILCLILIPRFGIFGAAYATATALVCESVLLFTVTKLRLGLHAFVVGR